MCRPGVSSSSEGSPQGLHQQPTVSPVFLILAGQGRGWCQVGQDPALQTKVNCFSSSRAWSLHCSSPDASACSMNTMSLEASLAATLWNCRTCLFMDGKLWEREITHLPTWGQQKCGSRGQDPLLTKTYRLPGFLILYSIHLSFPLPPCLSFSQREMVYCFFPLPVQYAFFSVFGHSFSKPIGVEFLS